jgi:hypothetical protein
MTNDLKVSISKGNAKMGGIPSVSLPAGITCNPGAPCYKECYARRIEYRYKESKIAYARNYSIYNTDTGAYWLQVRAAAVMNRFFRYHVSGDIPGAAYFTEMVKTAEMLPGTRFLAFTKQYKIVNDFINGGGIIPDNLKIIFSNWFTWKCENPHNLPVCEIIPKNGAPGDNWKVCGGNCTACACQGVGCWEVKNGDIIAIYKH